jgi:hypothetical protein
MNKAVLAYGQQWVQVQPGQSPTMASAEQQCNNTVPFSVGVCSMDFGRKTNRLPEMHAAVGATKVHR